MGPNRLGDSTDKTKSYRTAFGGLTSVIRLPAKRTQRMVPKTETNVTHTLTPGDTEVGDQPFSSNSDRLRETESHRTKFGIGCGNQFFPAMYSPEPDDAGKSDHPLSLGIVSPERTELCWTEFGASPTPRATERGDCSPLPRPNLSSGTGGATDPNRTVLY